MKVILDLCLDEVKDFVSRTAKENLTKIQRENKFDEEKIIKLLKVKEPVSIKELEEILKEK